MTSLDPLCYRALKKFIFYHSVANVEQNFPELFKKKAPKKISKRNKNYMKDAQMPTKKRGNQQCRKERKSFVIPLLFIEKMKFISGFTGELFQFAKFLDHSTTTGIKFSYKSTKNQHCGKLIELLKEKLFQREEFNPWNYQTSEEFINLQKK
jgi:hypothetical protein